MQYLLYKLFMNCQQYMLITNLTVSLEGVYLSSTPKQPMRMGRNWVGIQNFKPCSYTNTRHWYYTGICCLISIVLDSVSMTEEVLLTELLFVFLHQTLSVISTKLSFCYHGYRQTQWADQGSLKAHNASLLLHGMKFLQLHNLTHHCFFLLTQNCYKISLFKH